MFESVDVGRQSAETMTEGRSGIMAGVAGDLMKPFPLDEVFDQKRALVADDYELALTLSGGRPGGGW